MNEHPQGLSAFVAELKRRHVFRTLLAYGAVVFVVLQAAEIVLPAFGVGDWVLQLFVVLSVLGLPVVLVLAWVYEITPRGIRTMKEIDLQAGRKLEKEGSFAPRVALAAVTIFAASAAGLYWIRASVPAVENGGAGTTQATGAPEFRSADRRSSDVPIRSLAVLPFESFSPPSDDESGAVEGGYFAAGMHEALLSQLSRAGSFRVISRTTVQQYDPTGRSIAQVGEELGVEGIVEGSVTLDGGRVRITVQLIHAPSDTHVWSADYERDMEDIIALQREVAAAITDEIVGELVGAEEPGKRLAAGDADAGADPEAAVAEMKGRAVLSSAQAESSEELALAQRHFEDALREDSSYAPALVGLAGSTLMRELSSQDGLSPEALRSVTHQVERALLLDPDNPEARDILALMEAGFEGESIRVRVAVPDSVVAPRAPRRLFTTDLGARLTALSFERRASESLPQARVDAARTLVGVGRTGQAAEMLRKALEVSPAYRPAWDAMERMLVTTGRVDEVVELRRERRGALGEEEEIPGVPSIDELARAVARGGVDGYWEWRLLEINARKAAGAEVSALETATCHAALGRRDDAFAALRAAAESGDPELVTLRSDPTWDPYRRDPRFREIVRNLLGSGEDESD